jgi:transcription factor SPN1
MFPFQSKLSTHIPSTAALLHSFLVHPSPCSLSRDMDEHDPDLDPIDETTANAVLSDSELSDVDEAAYAGIDTNNIGVVESESEADEGLNVFALRPSKVKLKPDERRKKKEEAEEERRRKREARQQRHRQKEQDRQERAAPKKRRQPAESEDLYDPNKRPEDPEEARRWELDRAMDMAIAKKPVKRRKKDDDDIDLASAEGEKIQKLKAAMDQAYENDFDAVSNKKPATHKLALLPTVEAVLVKSSLHELILDSLLLMTIRKWLEPLPDKSLPAYSIQRTLLTALQKLPISKEHLAESGIGKIVMFYRNASRVEQSIRRIADALWVEWSRPILRKSANFRDRQIATASYDASMQLSIPRRIDQQESRRTVVPQTIRSTFDIAPRTTLDAASIPVQRGIRAENSDMFKRLKQKIQNKSAKKKQENRVSIQGGGRS